MAAVAKEKKKRVKKVPEPHWQAAVSVWYKFTEQKKGTVPSFDGSAPRDLKAIIKQLRERAEAKNIEWSELALTVRLNAFLERAYTYNWLQNNWLLFNINRQKDTIFFDLAKNNAQNR